MVGATPVRNFIVILRTMLVAAMIAVPSPASAEAPAPSSEIRLSQAEIDQVLADAAQKREARPQPVDGEARGRQVHGEVGFEVGSGGYRSVYGTTALELPDGGFAILSFQTGRSRRDIDYFIPDDRQR